MGRARRLNLKREMDALFKIKDEDRSGSKYRLACEVCVEVAWHDTASLAEMMKTVSHFLGTPCCVRS